MGNVLSDEKQQQVIALGRLGWSLRRIEEVTGIRRGRHARLKPSAVEGMDRQGDGDFFQIACSVDRISPCLSQERIFTLSPRRETKTKRWPA
ncbi:hypothetical protein HUA74_18585 [Myxococcus sp. CA051A]|uniref:hypothetical protein n=1 Tax=Myxococcus sp. CA051A TaxID=2741739 RepID=UPI00157B1761|nr:hypothetical protein [Myxococcus sp. CA051A]NTX62660.1 hypothetical protein [Myxococcus sp. CA051A]